MEDQQVQSLRAGSFGALLLAVFVVAVGYGFLLPVLPSVIEGLSGATDPNAVSRHAGFVTATYTLALFLFAPLWGHFADRHGRRPAILLGLGGLAFCLAIFAGGSGLFLLYLGRFVEGGFAAAVAPAVYALVGDISSSKDQRAHRFALLNIATSLGYLTGPMIGGVIVPAARTSGPRLSRCERRFWSRPRLRLWSRPSFRSPCAHDEERRSRSRQP